MNKPIKKERKKINIYPKNAKVRIGQRKGKSSDETEMEKKMLKTLIY